MERLKVLLVFGTRPEAMKMAPLAKELQGRPEFLCKICVTAQHRGMLDTVMENFGLAADYDFDIMKKGQTLCGITSRVIEKMEEVIADFRPEVVLVHGDTTTTMSAAIAAFYCGCEVGHVEAGLRTGDKRSPFPEELNRLVTGDVANIHFAPTENNVKNLARENITKQVFITGNTVIDALRYTVRPDYRFESPVLREVTADGRRLVLLTAHRRENLGEPHRAIFRAVKRLAEEYQAVNFVYPVHPNPRVSEPAHEILAGLPNVWLIDPLDTAEMHNLMDRSYLIMTDSGGLQEEGPALGKPVLVLRTETERPEAVAAGTVKISGVAEDAVYRDARELLDDAEAYREMAHAVNPYGDGEASRRIAEALLAVYRGGKAPEPFGA